MGVAEKVERLKIGLQVAFFQACMFLNVLDPECSRAEELKRGWAFTSSESGRTLYHRLQ
jgi:hypothetical protein